MIKLTESEFDNNFELETRDGGEEFQYETYDEDLELVFEKMKTTPNQVWTCVEVDDELFYLSGRHTVNRLYYFFTTTPYSDEDYIEVKLDIE